MKDLIQKAEEICDSKTNFIKKDYRIGDDDIRVYIYTYADIYDFVDDCHLELRGLTVNLSTNTIIARPLKKFFGLNEYDTIPDLSQLYSIQEKVDGSMVYPFIYRENGKEKIRFKTKLSPFSEPAISANRFVNIYLGKDFIDMNFFFIKSGYTPVYEFYSPENRIVIDYGDKPFMKLLALRSISTGKYFEFITVNDIKNYFNVNYKFLVDNNIPKRYSMNMSLDELKQLENQEGVVLVMKNGERYKVKTRWYLDRHVYFNMSDKYIIQTILDNKYDDLISGLKELKLFNMLHHAGKLKKQINDILIYIHNSILDVYHMVENLPSKKEKALAMNKILLKYPKNIRKLVFNIIINDKKVDEFKKMIDVRLIKSLLKKF